MEGSSNRKYAMNILQKQLKGMFWLILPNRDRFWNLWILANWDTIIDCMNNDDLGASIGLVDDNDLFKWSVIFEGPEDTLYEGGYFKAELSFPEDYPNNPPVMKFISKMWHPNIYPDGKVCISILHAPGVDELNS